MHRWLVAIILLVGAAPVAGVAGGEPVRVFVMAGDENMLRQGSIDGASREPGGRNNSGEADEDSLKPGSLIAVMESDPRFGFLRDATGGWAVRRDVALYDAHSLTNNTRSPARLLQVPADADDPRGFGVGPDLMFGHLVGDAFDDPVLLIRFATPHPVWFQRGSRSLGYDYLPPSAGGGLDLDGGWDVIHFNFGVWDQHSLDPDNPRERVEPDKGVIRVPIGEYEANLRAIVARLRQTGATLVWAHTTPVPEGTPPGFFGGDLVDQYNAVAAAVMEENGVIINDLNAECRHLGKPEQLNVHDVGDLSPKVTEVVLAALEARENPSRPVPRVLFIGDSITGTYWQRVRQNLDGKAFVAKNPGNAQYSGTGVRMVDQWVDFEQYLLNGQEYLELVDAVREVLADFDRYCPEFAGRTPELAGFVWFQGIADTQSDAFAAAYEDNLAALIGDLRRDLERPDLPFVVAAIGQSGEAMGGRSRQVHEAQMAVGDAAKHPEFAGNVASVDTIPFFFPQEESPGGREWDYFNNAKSFLLIGEALGRAMADLAGTD